MENIQKKYIYCLPLMDRIHIGAAHGRQVPHHPSVQQLRTLQSPDGHPVIDEVATRDSPLSCLMQHRRLSSSLSGQLSVLR